MADSTPSEPFVVELFGPRACIRRSKAGGIVPPLRTRKGLWLLALLALADGREIDRDRLAGTLWPDSSNTQALGSLRRALTDLRAALGTLDSARLESPTPRTLRLDLSSGACVDALSFDAAMAAGDFATAIALYRGPLLEGCDEPWVLTEREARAEAYLRAREGLADRALAAGDTTAAIAHLRAAAQADPLREPTLRALMAALARAGDHAAALLTYRDLRLRLRAEMNADPSPETSALFAQLREEARRAAAAPPSGNGGANPVAPPAPAPSTPSSLPPLPAPLTSFVGRSAEVTALTAQLSAPSGMPPRLIVLAGSGGVGKTRLALEAANALAEATVFVDLTPLPAGADTDTLARQVLLSLGQREEAGRPPLDSVCAALAEARVSPRLLIFDNCEHVTKAAGWVAAAALTAVPGMRVVATSRAPLNVPGEAIYRVEPLAVPKPEAASPEAVGASEAVRLFVERARLTAPGFALTPENALIVADICRHLDGVALAIELAAARLSVLTVREVAAGLSNRFRLLNGGSRGSGRRTLQASLDWSWDLLDDEGRTLLRRLSLFAGGFDRAAAHAVGGSLTADEWETLDSLAALVDRSLVSRHDGSSGGGVLAGDVARFRLLETVREYATMRLKESGEEDAIRRRHRAYFLGLAEEAVPLLQGFEQAEWLDRLARDHDNLRAALEDNLTDSAPGSATEALRLALALHPFWWARGHLREACAGLERALTRTETEEPSDNLARLRARARCHYASHLAALGKNDVAEAQYATARAEQERIGDRSGLADTRNAMGSFAYGRGELEQAAESLNAAIRLYQEAGTNENGLALAFLNLGNVCFARGEVVAAAEKYTECTALYRRLGNETRLADALSNLGNIRMALGAPAAARPLQEEALRLRSKLGHKEGIAGSYINLGGIAYELDDYAVAREHYEQALAVMQEIGHRRGQSVVLLNLGALASETAEYALARERFTQCVGVLRELGDLGSISVWLDDWAEMESRQGRLERAAPLWGAADALRASLQMVLPPFQAEYRDQSQAAARATLGDGAYAAAVAAGRAIGWEEAVAMALSSGTTK